MNNGWIKIHRKILEWGWYQDTNTARVFFHLLLIANHEDKQWMNITVSCGQCVVGRIELAKTLGLGQQSVRTALAKLKSTSEITIKPTNKYSLITIVKYRDYQIKTDKLTSKLTSKLTNEQPSTNHQLTTNKKIRSKENTFAADAAKEIVSIIEVFKEINPTLAYGNKTERQAAADLIKEIGFDQTLKDAKYAVSVLGEQFAPVITTPKQLSTLHGKLLAHSLRKNNGH